MNDTSKNNFFEFYNDQLRRDDVFSGIDEFSHYLEFIKGQSQYLYRRTVVGKPGPRTEIFDHKKNVKREMIMLGSNNYLDLASDPQVVSQAQKALLSYGNGSGSVSLLAGTYDLHRKLEKQLASIYSREDAVVFPTGYAANMGVISSLVRENDLIILDMYSHMSIYDGTKMTPATVKIFKHNDMEHLEKILSKYRTKFSGALIITDGVFSMDGDICKLDQLVDISKKYQARLMIDEAHALGVIGKHGHGTEEYFNLVGKVDIITGTLSKAPGAIGGYLVGSSKMVDYVRHFGSSYVFSTALPPSVVSGIITSLEIICKDTARRKQLIENIAYFISTLKKNGFDLRGDHTAIVPVIIGDESLTRILANRMDEMNIFVSPVVFPAVRKTESRLRFSIMSSHSKEDLDYVIKSMIELKREYGF